MGNWAVIGTWKMSRAGVKLAADILAAGGSAADAAEKAVMATEDRRGFMSVGYGGLPNGSGVVELDAGFMDGDTFAVGAVGALRDFKNPVSIARRLSLETDCNFLVGRGAEEYAHMLGFARKNMLTPKARALWEKQKQMAAKQKSYSGHDTVCVVALDCNGSVVAATSTSGLFMKRPGRVGDTPLVGSGFYADSKIGGAAATGIGENIMKGCLSYDAVQRMARGMSPGEAAESAVYEFAQKLLRGRTNECELMISVICVDKYGRFGAGSTIEFPHYAASSIDYTMQPALFSCGL